MNRRVFTVYAVAALIIWGLIIIAPCPASAFSVLWSTVNKNSDWSAIRDLTGDYNSSSVDISSYGTWTPAGAGTWDSVQVSSDGTSGGYIYFRFLLTGNPLSWNNSKGTWQINNSNCYEVMLSTNPNATSTTTQDYCVEISKTNAVELFQGTSSTPVAGDVTTFGNITQSGVDHVAGTTWTEANGNLLVTDTGLSAPSVTGNPEPTMCYIDMRIPFSWLSAFGVTLTTPIRAFYGTSNNDNNINKDYMIGSSLDFTQNTPFTFGDPSQNGAIYDTKDASPASDAGVWQAGESLQVNGFGWPTSAALTVKIYDPAGTTELWSGTVTASAAGQIASATLLTVPTSWTPGYYQIKVVVPAGTYAGTIRKYDTFEVRAPNMAVTKTVSPAAALVSTPVTYTVTMTNSGNVNAAMTAITDILPQYFTYVANSSKYNNVSISDPSTSINNNVQTLTWPGSWTVNSGGGTATLTFQATTGTVTGAPTNEARASGTNFAVQTSGPTAPVTVFALGITKTVSPSTVLPGMPVTYTITLTNTNGPAITVTQVADTLHTGFTYNGSTSGLTSSPPTGTTGTIHWDGSWTLPANGTLTLSFSATVSSSLGTYTNDASFTPTGYPVQQVLGTAPVVVGTEPAMSLTKSVDKASANPGDALTYTVYYHNTGGTAAMNLVLIDTVPPNTTYVAGSMRMGAASSTYATATPKTDAADADEAELSGGNLVFRVSSVAAGGDGKVYLKLNINQN